MVDRGDLSKKKSAQQTGWGVFFVVKSARDTQQILRVKGTIRLYTHPDSLPKLLIQEERGKNGDC